MVQGSAVQSGIQTSISFSNKEKLGEVGNVPSMLLPQSLEYQIKSIAKTFDLDSSKALNMIYGEKKLLDKNSKTYFAVPSFSVLAEKVLPGGDKHQQYCKVMEFIFKKFEGKYKFFNHCNDSVLPERFHRSKKSFELIEQIEKQQGNILLIETRFGVPTKNRTAYLIRENLLENEFCFGIFEIGSIILSHNWNDFKINCDGDGFMKSETSKGFEMAPFLVLSEGVLSFNVRYDFFYDKGFNSFSGLVH